MYRCFKVSLDLCEIQQNNKDYIDTCKKYGESLKRSLNESFNETLTTAIDENGVVSGEIFIDKWFPVENYDVFLSYSHDDEELALVFAGILKYQFGLKVFVDELIWGSADHLLRKLDNKYCKNDNDNYDYNKRNFTTTHVHAMLSTAIAKIIDNSETIFFLNSEKSTYTIKNEVDKERTLSPWIYEEIFFTSIIQKKMWYEHRPDYRLNEFMHFQQSLHVSYLLPTEHLIPMKYSDICSWYELWIERKNKGKGGYGDLFLSENEKIKHPLNVLYDLMCGYDGNEAK